MEQEPFHLSGPLDIELGEAMQVAYDLIAIHPESTDTPDQLRLRVAAHNLRALANVLLIADDNPERIGLNMKQVVLGLLGTSDWMTRNLPQLEEGEINGSL